MTVGGCAVHLTGSFASGLPIKPGRDAVTGVTTAHSRKQQRRNTRFERHGVASHGVLSYGVCEGWYLAFLHSTVRCGFVVLWCGTVPCRAVPCRAVSCRVVQCRGVLCCAVPCRAVPCHVVWCRVVSCRVVSRRVASCCVVPCRVVSCRIASCRVVSCCVVSKCGSGPAYGMMWSRMGAV